MLSATYSVADIKARVGSTFSAFGFADEAAYTAALTIYVDETRLMDLVPLIGESGYSQIEAKDRAGLSLREEYIYQAELYFSAGRFLENRAIIDQQSFQGDSVSASVDGVSRSVSGISKNGKRQAAATLRQKGYVALSSAGLGSTQIQRGNSMHTPAIGYVEGGIW